VACSAKRYQNGDRPGHQRPDPWSLYEPITDGSGQLGKRPAVINDTFVT
jgi:hypothetical protein